MAGRLTIYKGVDNTLKFNIKQSGSTLPMVITDTDTFTFKIIRILDDSVYLSGNASVVSKPDGIISISLTSSAVANMVSDKSSYVDGKFTKPTYKLLIIGNTVNNGNFIAKASKLYVE